VASAAGKLLRNPKTLKQVKSVAASALTQATDKSKSKAYLLGYKLCSKLVFICLLFQVIV